MNETKTNENTKLNVELLDAAQSSCTPLASLVEALAVSGKDQGATVNVAIAAPLNAKQLSMNTTGKSVEDTTSALFAHCADNTTCNTSCQVSSLISLPLRAALTQSFSGFLSSKRTASRVPLLYFVL